MRAAHLIILLSMVAVPAIANNSSDVTPYIADVPRPDMMKILPPPPAAGSPGEKDDRETFRETRTLQGGARWALATHDVGDDRFANFACAMGMRLSAETAPALARIFARIGGGLLINPVKDHYARRRPYLDQDLPICEPKTAHLAANGDYPSGHTTAGWSSALVLAELLPERATQILARGRAYGQSRYICGSHSKSAVEAGYMAGASLVATLHASAAFRADMEKARVEMRRLKSEASPVPAGQCTMEQSAQMP